MAAFQQAVGHCIDVHPLGAALHGFQHLQPFGQRSGKGIHQTDFSLRKFFPQRGGRHFGGSIAAADAAGHPHK